MVIRLYCMLLSYFFLNYCNGQNLIPNPSFEDTLSCPNDLDQVSKCIGWSGYSLSPDYFNKCNSYRVGVPSNLIGNQNASTGKAYCGIITYTPITSNFREMIGAKLSQKLIKGNKYFTSMNVSLADKSKFASNCLGISFSTVSRTSSAYTIVNKGRPFIYSKYVIKDSINWVNINGSFIADSNYQYIIIGNFHIDSLTQIENSNSPFALFAQAYYYIDDVCVSTDSLTCVSKVGVSLLKNITNKYHVVYPNPFVDKITIQVNEVNSKEVVIFDIFSKELLRQSFSDTITLDLEFLPKGVYYYELHNKLVAFERGKLVKE